MSREFSKRKIWVVTKHDKAACIRDCFQELLGAEIVESQGIDTDTLGTFTGEVDRPEPPDRLVVTKARLALRGEQARDCSLASEGSFGPHPYVPWLPFHEEFLAFVDGDRDLCWVEVERTTDTVFRHVDCSSWDDLELFAKQVGFPEQGLILRGTTSLVKGIRDWETLKIHFVPGCRAETDMRAQHCPSRRSIIERVGRKLAARLLTVCPGCQAGGFGLVGQMRGLPCQLCRRPTELVEKLIHGCAVCKFQQLEPRPDGRVWAEPRDCSYCNP